MKYLFTPARPSRIGWAARPVVAVLALFLVAPAAQAQFKLPNLGAKLENAVNSRLSKGADKIIDKGLDKTEKTATQAVKDELKPASATAGPGPAAGTVSSHYDFVPGTQVLFEDKLTGEAVGEFPARWNLLEGSAEVVRADGQPAIQVANGGAISPLFKQANYLPNAFTLELDLYLAPGERCSLWLWDKRQGHQAANGSLGELEITQTSIRVPGQQLGQELPGADANAPGGWHRLALAFNQRSLKVYLDRHRLLNVPNATGRPTGLTLSSVQAFPKSRPLLLRNIRLAEGGKDLYARLAADGRIVTHDIHFDPGQAIVKPASQPTIDQLASLLKSQPDLRFRVEGHTDADGDAAANQRLSQARAEAVRAALVRAGIASSRLTATGWGEAKPLDPGNTASAKAQNRRVEFVKL
jgi:outer membrane protein OmpA-like peptidoglycan-associated protein